MEDRLQELSNDYQLLAAVGMKKPQQNIPFIPLEALIDGDGERMLKTILRDKKITRLPAETSSTVVERLCEESLQKFLTYLNPAKVMGGLLEFDKILEKELAIKLSNPLRIRLIVHCGCALERIVTRSSLAFKDDKSKVDTQKLAAVKKAANVFDKTLKLHFDEDEFYFIASMI